MHFKRISLMQILRDERTVLGSQEAGDRHVLLDLSKKQAGTLRKDSGLASVSRGCQADCWLKGPRHFDYRTAIVLWRLEKRLQRTSAFQ